MATIIAIANEKGGVAKTTTTLSVGGALVEAGHEVLMVDLDAQANLTLALGIEPPKTRYSIANILLESMNPIKVSRETGVHGLDIIPSNAEMGVAEKFLPTRQNYEYTLRRALRETSPLYYDFILLDCPPFLGAVTINALTASDLLVIPTQAEFFSITALRTMMNQVRRIRATLNSSLTYRLLLTMVDRRNKTHRTLSEQLQVTFGNGLFQSMIETDTKLRECPIAGLPITLYAPKSRSAMQYRNLAQEISEYVQESTAQPA